MLNDMVAAFTASSKIGEAMQKENQTVTETGATKPEEPETPSFDESESV